MEEEKQLVLCSRKSCFFVCLQKTYSLLIILLTGYRYMSILYMNRCSYEDVMKEYRLKLENLDCASCAAELESAFSKIKGIETCTVDFMQLTCIYACDPENHDEADKEIRRITAIQEPDVVIREIDDEKDSEDDSRWPLYRLLIGIALFLVGLFSSGTVEIIFLLSAYAVLGYDVLYKAFRNILHGSVFDENFLMGIATLAALFLQDYKEAVSVMLFYQVGEYFQDKAVDHSRASISALMDIRPDYANVNKDGEYVRVSPAEVKIDDVIQVKPGEKVPLDGIVLSGTSSLDTASLTGESKPRDVEPGSDVANGCVNINGLLTIRVTRAYADSTVSQILDMVQNAQNRKTKTENFITKFSRIYTPTVVVGALVLAIGLLIGGFGVYDAVTRACSFLVISCPCALVISVPLGFFSGIGGLSKRGILVKGSSAIEELAKINQTVFDKTGTLTAGTFTVAHVIGSEETLKDAAYAESSSNHPIAKGIMHAYKGTVDKTLIQAVKEIPGRGLSIDMENNHILAGNKALMADNGIQCPDIEETGTRVYVAKNGTFEGCLIVADELKEKAASAIDQLHKDGMKCILVSGDSQDTVDTVSAELHMDGAHAQCLPSEKVNIIQKLKENGPVAFVGDGVNDAPVLVEADIGIAMGAFGSDAAIEAADVVIMDDDPEKVSVAIHASKKTLHIVKQNIYGAILAKLIILVLAAFGIAGMWMAIFADVGVAMICILNSMRLLYTGKTADKN